MSEFKCKSFVVKQDKTAMKVGTDSLILGAWSAASQLSAEPFSRARILDIGTGTGLLSLMLAQKTDESVNIDAIEIDADAFLQACDNFKQSAWATRLNAISADFIEFSALKLKHSTLAESHLYQWIISNPPYFSSGNCADSQRQLARQQTQLAWFNLFENAASLLAEDGVFECVLPADNLRLVLNIASQISLKLIAQLNVYPNPKKPLKRVCLRFKKLNTKQNSDCDKRKEPVFTDKYNDSCQVETLIIYDDNNQYTSAYKSLCQAYYLKF